LIYLLTFRILKYAGVVLVGVFFFQGRTGTIHCLAS